jgi:hypothetical protein
MASRKASGTISTPIEEKEFKEAAKHVLALTEKQLAELAREGDFVEVKRT